MRAACECGNAVIEASAPPAVRFYCHCTICQEVYGAPFADITAQWSWRLKVVGGELDYRRYLWLPSSVKRGLCASCRSPILGRLQIPPLPVTFVPSRLWSDQDLLPAPVGHIFYRSRVADIDDQLPKAMGLWASQIAASRWMVPRLLSS